MLLLTHFLSNSIEQLLDITPRLEVFVTDVSLAEVIILILELVVVGLIVHPKKLNALLVAEALHLICHQAPVLPSPLKLFKCWLFVNQLYPRLCTPLMDRIICELVGHFLSIALLDLIQV